MYFRSFVAAKILWMAAVLVDVTHATVSSDWLTDGGQAGSCARDYSQATDPPCQHKLIPPKNLVHGGTVTSWDKPFPSAIACTNMCSQTGVVTLPLCCWWLIWPIQNHAKNLKNDWNPGKWVLIWKYSTRAIRWIPTWQGFNVFQKSLRSCALDKSSLSIGRVKL